MRMCSECGLSGDLLYSNGNETAVLGCPIHPRAQLYRIERGRVIWRDLDRWGYPLRGARP